MSYDVGKIARTEARFPLSGSKTIDSSDPYWKITAEGGFPSERDLMEAMGGTNNGWSEGLVYNTCADIETKPGYWARCQYRVTDSGPGDGDSGGPVFEITDEDESEVTLHGIIVGGNASYYMFSGLGYIYMELGPSETWDTCYGGGC